MAEIDVATYKLIVEYEGTRYRGWQEQKNARSVSGEIRKALLAAGVEIVEIGGSGRTDAGVHAVAQTAHVRTRGTADPEPLRRALNEALPADIHVSALVPASERFHARHDAVWRAYLYQISRRRTAFAKRHVWWVKRPLDCDRMREAAALVVGRHDFSLFCEKPSEQKSTVVVVNRVEVVEDGALILVRYVASHFLWKMVRRITGALVRVGGGDLTARDVRTLLDGRPLGAGFEGTAASTAPPSGLFLEAVGYPGDAPLGPPRAVVSVPPERAASPSRRRALRRT